MQTILAEKNSLKEAELGEEWDKRKKEQEEKHKKEE